MANISISDLCTNNSESTLLPLDRTEHELIKAAIARALSVRGGLAISGIKPGQTDGMVSRDRSNGPSF